MRSPYTTEAFETQRDRLAKKLGKQILAALDDASLKDYPEIHCQMQLPVEYNCQALRNIPRLVINFIAVR